MTLPSLLPARWLSVLAIVVLTGCATTLPTAPTRTDPTASPSLSLNSMRFGRSVRMSW